MKKGPEMLPRKDIYATGEMDASDGDGDDRPTLADRLEEQQRAWKVLI
jgi:hypothetical protein